MELWFQEEHDSHMRLGYRIRDVLFSERSPWQKVEVVDSRAWGKMLLIDGMVMLTEKDEFVYHEMISHIPVLMHRHPRQVMIIGGGDGGTVRELLKHDSIEKILLCELDDLVLEASRRFFPEVACGLDDDRVEIFIGDGLEKIAAMPSAGMDLVLVDSTDPAGPGEVLFGREFYRSVAAVLKPDGLMACQSESPWYDGDMLRRIHDNIGSAFTTRLPWTGPVPTYPTGFWSWTLAGNHRFNAGDICRERFRGVRDQLHYLEEDMLPGIFAIPRFYRDKLNGPAG